MVFLDARVCHTIALLFSTHVVVLDAAIRSGAALAGRDTAKPHNNLQKPADKNRKQLESTICQNEPLASEGLQFVI